MPSSASATSTSESSQRQGDVGTGSLLTTVSERPTAKPRKHHCNQCSKKFVRLEHLLRHQRTHTREKPFPCEKCPRTFARRDLLLRHDKTLHNSTSQLNLPLPDGLADPEENIFQNRNVVETSSDIRTPPYFHGAQLPQVEYQQVHNDFNNGIALDPILVNNHNQEAQALPGTHTSDAMAFEATDVAFLMQEPFPNLDWMDAFDLSTTTYSAVFHTAQPLWPVTNASPESCITDNAPIEPISESFEGTLPQPSTSHRGVLANRKIQASRTLFERMFSRRSSLEPRDSSPLSLPSNWKPAQITSAVRAVLVLKIDNFPYPLPNGFTLPSQHALCRYVSGYFDGFHQHLPFIHTPTWNAETCDIGLFIAMCALGARYCFEHETSMCLWKAGKTMVRSKVEERGDQVVRENVHGVGDTSLLNPETSVEIIDKCQAMFLLMAFSTWTGDKYLLRQALSFQSALAAMVRQDGLKQEHFDQDMAWEDWIKYERAKRIKFVIYCFFNLQCLAYDTPPLILNGEIELDLPCEEDSWRAPNAQEWQQIRGNRTTTSPSFSVLLRELLLGSSSQVQSSWRQSYTYSTFGCYVLIYGLIQHNFQLQNYTRSMLGVDSSLPVDQVKILEKALSRWQRAWENNPEASLDPRNPHGPLAFNCTALLRMAYIRLDIDFGPICATLQSGDPQIVAQAMYHGPLVQRGPRLRRAALHACHALLIPVKIGIHLVAHTQVFVWSIQHAVASFECCLILAKWLLAVTVDAPSPPLSEEESWLIRLVQETLKECQMGDVEDIKMLSANVLKAWATVFHGTTVWGVMPLMGTALQKYAELLGG